ncbi:hypothetical protein [Zoogloea sp.]|uniref:hypothetical protein n=1 Tax=Zoogloea sp. TaxID=49181 RepID=UPI0026219496|nr:hypothetical protein [uncultured Zoogloea sp.]
MGTRGMVPLEAGRCKKSRQGLAGVFSDKDSTIRNIYRQFRVMVVRKKAGQGRELADGPF